MHNDRVVGESNYKGNIGLDSSIGVNIVVAGVIGGVSLYETYGYGQGNKDTFELIDQAKLYDASLNDPEKRLSHGVFSDTVPPEKND